MEYVRKSFSPIFSVLILSTFIILPTCFAIYPAHDSSSSYNQEYSESSSYQYPQRKDEDNYNQYYGREILDRKGRYILEWSVEYRTKMIKFNITCNTTGWVGLGLSKDGQMKEADIMIGGVRPNGQPFLVDTYADYSRKVYSDTKQDWILISAVENYGVTYLRVARPWDTCDPYDYPISMDLLSVIWAYGPTDDYEYHFEKRGSFRVYLLDPIIRTYVKPLEVWQIRKEVTMTSRNTSYICSIHRAPILTQKHHIVEVHVYLENQIAEKHVHHIILWRCVAPPGIGTDVVFEPLTAYPGEECYFNRAHVLPILLCKFVVAGWSIGGKPFILPYSVGIPLGESPAEYYMLETHYDNPLVYSGVKIISGLDLYYTDKLRPNDGGVLFIAGYDVLGLFMIPPISTDFEVYGYCTPNCTKTIFPDSGIEIVAATLHAHLSGRKLRLQQFRNGSELEVILKDDNYDSSFQQIRVLYEPRLVLPGDQLVMTCEYDNTWFGNTTVSGFSTREEMCIGIVLMKKRVPYFTCNSQVPQETLLPLIGVDHVEWDMDTQERVITKPPALAGKPLRYVTDGLVEWDKSLRYRIQDVTVKSRHIGSCPKILAPAGVDGGQTDADDATILVGTVISSTSSAADILTLAKGYGVDTLMGTVQLPTRTPGPVSYAKYPYSGVRYPGRTCPRPRSPFTNYYSGGTYSGPVVLPSYSSYSYYQQPQMQYVNPNN